MHNIEDVLHQAQAQQIRVLCDEIHMLSSHEHGVQRAGDEGPSLQVGPPFVEGIQPQEQAVERVYDRRRELYAFFADVCEPSVPFAAKKDVEELLQPVGTAQADECVAYYVHEVG